MKTALFYHSTVHGHIDVCMDEYKQVQLEITTLDLESVEIVLPRLGAIDLAKAILDATAETKVRRIIPAHFVLLKPKQGEKKMTQNEFEDATRKVIGRGCISSCGGLSYCIVKSDKNHGVPDGTPVEIVALVEPKRKLVRPEGAVWMASKVCSRGTSLVVAGHSGTAVTHASYASDATFGWNIGFANGWHSESTLEKAQRAAEEALADAGLHGFRWVKEPPETIHAGDLPDEDGAAD